eukprot:m.294857 g.294857  ORF g.294857 m.294857 type:complete len:677 (-) comp13071_c0_seq1:406-2436(-)
MLATLAPSNLASLLGQAPPLKRRRSRSNPDGPVPGAKGLGTRLLVRRRSLSDPVWADRTLMMTSLLPLDCLELLARLSDSDCAAGDADAPGNDVDVDDEDDNDTDGDAAMRRPGVPFRNAVAPFVPSAAAAAAPAAPAAAGEAAAADSDDDMTTAAPPTGVAELLAIAGNPGMHDSSSSSDEEDADDEDQFGAFAARQLAQQHHRALAAHRQGWAAPPQFLGGGPHIHSLPNELLAMIFSQLSVSERHNVSRVCRRWYAVVKSSPIVWERVTMAPRMPSALIFNTVGRVGHLMRRLELGFGSANDEFLAAIGAGCPHLHSLEARGSVGVTDLGIAHLAAGTGSSLRSLVLADCHDLTDVGIAAVVESCQNVSHLCLAGSFQLTGAPLTALRGLSSLDLSFSPGITSAAVAQVIRTNPNIKGLSLAGCPHLDDSVLYAIATLSHLERLDISHCTGFSGTGLTTVLRACRRLVSVGLSNCPSVEVVELEGLKLCSLTHVDISNNLYLSDRALFALARAVQLTSVNLSGCLNVTDNGVCAILAACPKLRSLNLGNCTSLSATTFRELAVCSSSIEALDFMNMRHINHLVLLQTLLSCHSLVSLNLSGCRIDDSMISLLASSHRDMQLVNLGDCSHLAKSAFSDLALRCRKLKDLVLFGSTLELDDPSLQFFVDECRIWV